MDHTAGAEFLAELGILRIVVGLRLLLRVEVIQIAKKFIEAMYGRKMIVAVPEVVLAKLAAGVALLLQ